MAISWQPKIELKVEPALGRFALHEEAHFPYDDLLRQYTRILVDTRDAKIREGLIALGWTPPPAAEKDPA
jgi:hypothetical protein